MDKIIGIGNALVDALVTLSDDKLLETIRLPKGSMQLIDETKLFQINELFSTMHPKRATGGSAGIGQYGDETGNHRKDWKR